MNSLRNKHQIGPEEWTMEIKDKFQALKATYVTNSSPVVRLFPISRGSPRGVEFILHIVWSKWGMAAVLYQDQGGSQPLFL